MHEVLKTHSTIYIKIHFKVIITLNILQIPTQTKQNYNGDTFSTYMLDFNINGED